MTSGDKKQAEFTKESDRGAVIVAAAILEDDLKEMLNKIFVAKGLSNELRKNLFDLSGPLSSFSSKSLICYGFGLISKDTFDDLAVVRKLRNRFAHSWMEVDFLSEEIKSIVLSLKCATEAQRALADTGGESTDEQPEDEAQPEQLIKTTKAIFCLASEILRTRLVEHQLAKIQGRAI